MKTLSGNSEAGWMNPSSVEAEALLADYFRMTAEVATALAIGADQSLQGRLRELAGMVGHGRFQVSRFQGKAWIEISDNARASVHRHKIDGLPAADLDLAYEQEPGFLRYVQRAISETNAETEARTIVDPLLNARALPSREQVARLRTWAPLLEALSYRCATRVTTLLDELRPHITTAVLTSNPVNPHLAAYWSGMHILGNLIFLASEIEAKPWLSEMADQFPWQDWTPTFPLIRERTVWLAACAARSAIAFGEPVVGKYLRKLAAANHPMKAFDALYGLTAIARAYPATAISILAEIRLLKAGATPRNASHLPYFEKAYDDAMDAILERDLIAPAFGEEAQWLGWRQNSKRGLCTPRALSCDPATITSSGRFLGFAILPAVIVTQPDEYYAAAEVKRELNMKDQEIAQILYPGWGGRTSPAVSHATLH